MEREIKYRAWNKPDSLMLDVYQLFWHQDGLYASGTIGSDNDGPLHFEGIAPDEFVLMQFTGMTDRAGKEIYEGDIFKLGAEKELFEVRFQHGCFMAFRAGEQIGLVGELQICFIGVIGNIYENPELL